MLLYLCGSLKLNVHVHIKKIMFMFGQKLTSNNTQTMHIMVSFLLIIKHCHCFLCGGSVAE